MDYRLLDPLAAPPAALLAQALGEARRAALAAPSAKDRATPQAAAVPRPQEVPPPALRPPQAPRPALHEPSQTPDFVRARADIEACALTDALIEAEDAHAELQSRFTDLRAMKPATAALLFGSEAAWRQALARVGVAAGRRLSAVEALRTRLRATPDFSLATIARPLGANTRVQWTGD